MKKVLVFVLVLCILIASFSLSRITIHSYSDSININPLSKSYFKGSEFLSVYDVTLDYTTIDGVDYVYASEFVVNYMGYSFYFFLQDPSYVYYLSTYLENDIPYVPLLFSCFDIGIFIDGGYSSDNGVYIVDGFPSFDSAFHAWSSYTNNNSDIFFFYNSGSKVSYIYHYPSIVYSVSPNERVLNSLFDFVNFMPFEYIFKSDSTRGYIDPGYFWTDFQLRDVSSFSLGSIFSSASLGATFLPNIPDLPDRSDFNTDIGFISAYFEWVCFEIFYVLKFTGLFIREVIA